MWAMKTIFRTPDCLKGVRSSESIAPGSVLLAPCVQSLGIWPGLSTAQPVLWPWQPFPTPVGRHVRTSPSQRPSSPLLPSLPQGRLLQLPVTLAPWSPDWTCHPPCPPRPPLPYGNVLDFLFFFFFSQIFLTSEYLGKCPFWSHLLNSSVPWQDFHLP